jgi:uncharacterized protein
MITFLKKTRPLMPMRVIIVHRWEGNPDADWYPWLKEDLEKRGYEVVIPAMPSPEEPMISEWTKAIKAVVGDADGHIILVGHSIGCQAIIRYLSELENGSIGGAVLVAPWITLTGLEKKEKAIAKSWLETPLDWIAARQHCDEFTCIFSDDDPHVPLGDAEVFKQNLLAKVVVEYGKGHFEETPMPIILNEIEEIQS